MNLKLGGLILTVVVVVIAGWADLQYFGPRFFKTSSTSQNNHPSPRSSNNTATPNARILVDFGNGTRLWFNETGVPLSWNYYNLTYQVTRGDMVAVWNGFPLNSHYVFSILGFGCQQGQFSCGGGYWSLWTWNQGSSCWAYSPLGIDRMKISDTPMIGWYWKTSGSLKPECP